MPVNFLRSSIKTGQLVATASAESVVEGDIIVSDIKPDIARVLWVDGVVSVNSNEVVQDRVMVEGAIDFDIVYVPEGENGMPQSIDGSISFSQYIDVPGAKPKMSCDLDVKLQYIDYALLNGRKLDIKAIVTIDANVIDELQLDVAAGVSDMENIEFQKRIMPLTTVVGSGSSQVLIRQGVELRDEKPSIKELIYYRVRPLIDSFNVLDNRVAVNGTLNLLAVYATDEQDNMIEYVEDEMGFEHTIDVPGAYVGLDCLPKAMVTEVSAEVKENPLGERRLINIEAMVELKASLFEKEQIEFINDIYGVGTAISAEVKEIRPMEYIGSSRIQIPFKDVVNIVAGPEIDKVYAIKGDAVVSEYSAGNGNINVEGTIRVEGMYSAAYSQQLIHGFAQEIPFKAAIPMDGADENCIVKFSALVRNISCSLVSSDAVDVKGEVLLNAVAWRSAAEKVVLSADISEQPVERPTGIIIYFVQPGDTLWSIAKRYSTTTARLKKINGLDDEASISAGMKLLIYNNIVV